MPAPTPDATFTAGVVPAAWTLTLTDTTNGGVPLDLTGLGVTAVLLALDPISGAVGAPALGWTPPRALPVGAPTTAGQAILTWTAADVTVAGLYQLFIAVVDAAGVPTGTSATLTIRIQAVPVADTCGVYALELGASAYTSVPVAVGDPPTLAPEDSNVGLDVWVTNPPPGAVLTVAVRVDALSPSAVTPVPQTNVAGVVGAPIIDMAAQPYSTITIPLTVGAAWPSGSEFIIHLDITAFGATEGFDLPIPIG